MSAVIACVLAQPIAILLETADQSVETQRAGISAATRAIPTQELIARHIVGLSVFTLPQPILPNHQALVLRGITLTVAARARAPIIELRYGLPRYFAR